MTLYHYYSFSLSFKCVLFACREPHEHTAKWCHPFEAQMNNAFFICVHFICALHFDLVAGKTTAKILCLFSHSWFFHSLDVFFSSIDDKAHRESIDIHGSIRIIYFGMQNKYFGNFIVHIAAVWRLVNEFRPNSLFSRI